MPSHIFEGHSYLHTFDIPSALFVCLFVCLLSSDDERLNTCRLHPGSVSRESSSVPRQFVQLPDCNYFG